MQISADAFNLLNHTIVTSVVGTQSLYLNAGASSGTLKCNASTVPSGSALQGCIAPYNGTGLGAFRRNLRNQQRPLRRTPDAVRRQTLLLTHL